MIHGILKSIVIVILIPSFCIAQIPGFEVGGRSGSEYYVGRDQGTPLIKVHILSGVRSPGVYHVPINTNLLELIAYAGGALESSDLSEVSLKNQSRLKESKMIDLEEVIRKNNSAPVVKDKDVIHIPTPKDTLSRTGLLVTVISGIASLVLTVFVISDR